MPKELVEMTVKYVTSTEEAVLVDDDSVTVWIPKSLIEEDQDYSLLERHDEIEICIPFWFAEQEEFL